MGVCSRVPEGQKTNSGSKTLSETIFMSPLNPSTVGFRPEFLDFEQGIRVGNLEPNERITRLLKWALEERYGHSFVTDRWGRGVYWQWICFLPRADREAKSLSSKVNFGCAKFFIMMDRDEAVFKCGMQVERGYLKPPRNFPQIGLKDDWDWHRLVKGLTPGGRLTRELKRLVVREGFRLFVGNWDDAWTVKGKQFPSTRVLRKALNAAPPRDWAGFQVYYPMSPEEVRGSSGAELVEPMLAVFEEVTSAMNCCMQIALPTSAP